MAVRHWRSANANRRCSETVSDFLCKALPCKGGVAAPSMVASRHFLDGAACLPVSGGESRFVEKNQKIRRGWRVAKLSQKCHDLAPMIGGMIHEMLHHVDEWIFPTLAATIFVGDPVLQTFIGKVVDEGLLVTRESCPSCFDGCRVGELFGDKHPLGRLALPSLQPQPFGP